MTQGSVQITNAQYHKDPAISASMLKVMAKHGPKSYWNSFHNPDRPERKTTPALLLGSLTHAAILEPDDLENQFGPCPNKKLKAGREEAERLKEKGITPVQEDQWELAMAMRDSVYGDKEAKALLSKGVAEKSWWSVDESTSLDIKARSDWFTGTTIVDLKTSQGGVDPKEFAKTVANFQYHIQAAHYLEVTGADRFIFLVVQKQWPFDVGLYELDNDSIDLGLKERRKALDQINECQISDHWPGHSDSGVQSLTLPRWAFPSTPN